MFGVGHRFEDRPSRRERFRRRWYLVGILRRLPVPVEEAHLPFNVTPEVLRQWVAGEAIPPPYVVGLGQKFYKVPEPPRMFPLPALIVAVVIAGVLLVLLLR